MADNIVVMNQGKNPLVSYNFMLRVEGVFDIPCKAVHSFKKENEYEYIQEGGLNDYVHMRRKPISQPFTFTIERYVGTDYYDPLYNGAELVLPLILLVSRYNNKFEVTKRSYVFTGCTVMSKEYGELNGEKSGLHTENIVIGYREMLVVTNPADFPIGNWMDDRTSEASRKSTNTKFAVSYKDENAEDNNKFLNKGNWMDDRGKDEASKKSTSVKYATNNKNDGDRYYKGNWINDVKNNNVNENGVVEGYATRYKDNTSEDNNKFLNKGNWMSDRSENDSSTAVKYATRNVKDDERYRRGNWIKDKREYATRYKDNKSDDNNKFLNKGNWINDKGEYATRYKDNKSDDNNKFLNKGNWINGKGEYATRYKDNTSEDNNKFLNKGNWMSGRSENDSSTAVKYASRNVRDDERSRKGNWISDKGEYATRYKDNASEDNNKYLNKGNWMSGRSENDTATSVKYARQSAKDSDRAVPRKWPTVSSAKKIDSGDKK